MGIMDNQKLDSGTFVRLHSETIDALKRKAKRSRRKLAELIRIVLEDFANADN